VTPQDNKTHQFAHATMENMKMKTTLVNYVTINVLFVPDLLIIVTKEVALMSIELMTMFVNVWMVIMMPVLPLVLHA
jgi:hypothetical protein